MSHGKKTLFVQVSVGKNQRSCIGQEWFLDLEQVSSSLERLSQSCVKFQLRSLGAACWHHQLQLFQLGEKVLKRGLYSRAVKGRDGFSFIFCHEWQKSPLFCLRWRNPVGAEWVNPDLISLEKHLVLQQMYRVSLWDFPAFSPLCRKRLAERFAVFFNWKDERSNHEKHNFWEELWCAQTACIMHVQHCSLNVCQLLRFLANTRSRLTCPKRSTFYTS